MVGGPWQNGLRRRGTSRFGASTGVQLKEGGEREEAGGKRDASCATVLAEISLVKNGNGFRQTQYGS